VIADIYLFEINTDLSPNKICLQTTVDDARSMKTLSGTVTVL